MTQSKCLKKQHIKSWLFHKLPWNMSWRTRLSNTSFPNVFFSLFLLEVKMLQVTGFPLDCHCSFGWTVKIWCQSHSWDLECFSNFFLSEFVTAWYLNVLPWLNDAAAVYDLRYLNIVLYAAPLPGESSFCCSMQMSDAVFNHLVFHLSTVEDCTLSMQHKQFYSWSCFEVALKISHLLSLKFQLVPAGSYLHSLMQCTSGPPWHLLILQGLQLFIQGNKMLHLL